MSHPKISHNSFRPLVLLFSIWCFCQFSSGAFLYLYKIGFSYPKTLAYYKGNAFADSYFKKDVGEENFAPRSFYSLVELSLWHTLAYSILIFILAHFLRSLTRSANWANQLSLALFLLAILEVFSNFGARYGPPYFSLFRLVLFYSFVLCGNFASLALFVLCLPRK